MILDPELELRVILLCNADNPPVPRPLHSNYQLPSDQGPELKVFVTLFDKFLSNVQIIVKNFT